jgi:hypothetical protein
LDVREQGLIMARFDLLNTEYEFTNTDTIEITHNLDRPILSVRLIINGEPRLSRRELVSDILLDPSDPLNKCTVKLRAAYTGAVQLIADDTIQSPYYSLEDKLQSQVGLARFPVQLVMNGTMSNGDYVTYSNLISNPAIRFPTNSKISELTWNNNRTSVDFDLQFNRYEEDGTPYAGNPFYTYQARNVDYGDIETGLDYDLGSGDCVDLVLVLWCYKLAE